MNDEGYEAHSLTGVSISSFQNVHARGWYSLRGRFVYESATPSIFKKTILEKQTNQKIEDENMNMSNHKKKGRPPPE